MIILKEYIEKLNYEVARLSINSYLQGEIKTYESMAYFVETHLSYLSVMYKNDVFKFPVKRISKQI